MDYDEHIVEEVENNSTLEASDLAKEIMFLIFGILGALVNVLLIYIICYFRKLHTTTNIYLVNWAIADIGAALSSVGYFEVFSTLLNVPENVLVFYYNVEVTLSIISMFFMILLTLDWCFSAYLPRFVDKFREHTAAIVAVLWIVSAVYVIVSTATVLITEHIYIFHLTVFGLFLAFVVVLHCIRLAYKLRGNFEYYSVTLLLLPTTFLVCWMLCWISLVLLFANDVYYNVFTSIADAPVFLHPTINFIVFLFLDKDFKACFLQVTKSFTCCGLIKPLPQNREENGVCNES